MRLYLIAVLGLLFSIQPHIFADSSKPVLFAGTNSTEGRQLWQTDNTESGTKILTYLNPPPTADSKPKPLGVMGKWSLFVAFTPETGHELWRTDGTPQGTSLVKELGAGTESGVESNAYSKPPLVAGGQRLVLWGRTTQHLRLISSDGTPEGTQIIKQFPVNAEHDTPEDEPRFYASGELQFFYVDSEAVGIELWRTDGTSLGTQLVVKVKNPKEDTTTLSTDSPLATPQALYVFGEDQGVNNKDTTPYTLWRTDGTTTTALIKLSLAPNASPDLLAVDANNLIYQLSSSDAKQPDIWALDLKTQQAQPLPPFELSSKERLVITNDLLSQDKLYTWLGQYDDSTEQSLWVTDLKAKINTHLLTLPASNASDYTRPFAFANRVYFFTNDKGQPDQLWTTDGTPQGTVKLIAHEAANQKEVKWNHETQFYVWRHEYLLVQTFSPKGSEWSKLWSVSAANPTQPIVLGEFETPYLLRPAATDQGKLLYFISGTQRYQTDGTLEGTKAIGPEPLCADRAPTGCDVLDQTIALPTMPTSWLLAYNNSKTGNEPWLIHTDLKQTQLLKDINTHPASASVGDVHSAGGYTYWRSVWQLWVSDGSAAHATVVSDIPKTDYVKTGGFAGTLHGDRVFGTGIATLTTQQDSLYLLTIDSTNNNEQSEVDSLWQVQAGHAKRLKTFEPGMAFLAPSRTGVYELYMPKAGGYELIQRFTNGDTKTLLKSPPSAQEQLYNLLETPQGLLYITETTPSNVTSPSDAASLEEMATSAPTTSLWLLRPNSTQAVLLSHEVDRMTELLSLNEHVYVSSNKGMTSPRFYAVDFNTQKLTPTPIAVTPDGEDDYNSSERPVLASTKGLFLNQRSAKRDQLWYWAEGMAKPQLLKEIPSESLIELIQTVGDTLYFNVRPEYKETGDLWISQGTVESTRLLKAGVRMASTL